MSRTERTLESPDLISAAAREQLKAFVARIERLEEGKKALGADLKEVYAEAKAFGYDTKILRKVVALRRMDQNERTEMEALLALYSEAIEWDSTPLAQAAKACGVEDDKPLPLQLREHEAKKAKARRRKGVGRGVTEARADIERAARRRGVDLSDEEGAALAEIVADYRSDVAAAEAAAAESHARVDAIVTASGVERALDKTAAGRKLKRDIAAGRVSISVDGETVGGAS